MVEWLTYRQFSTQLTQATEIIFHCYNWFIFMKTFQLLFVTNGDGWNESYCYCLIGFNQSIKHAVKLLHKSFKSPINADRFQSSMRSHPGDVSLSEKAWHAKLHLSLSLSPESTSQWTSALTCMWSASLGSTHWPGVLERSPWPPTPSTSCPTSTSRCSWWWADSNLQFFYETY